MYGYGNFKDCTSHDSRSCICVYRSMPVFFGIIGPSICFSPQAFGTPSKKLDKTTFEKVWSRLSLNFAYFLSNYVMIFFGVCVVVSLTYTDMIFYLALTSACWWFHLATKRNHIPITLFGKNLDDYISMHSRTKILWTFTGFVVMFYCLLPFFTMVSVSSVLVLTHALFRDPKHIDVASSSMFTYYHDEDDDSDYEEDDNSGDSSRESEVLVESTDIMP